MKLIYLIIGILLFTGTAYAEKLWCGYESENQGYLENHTCKFHRTTMKVFNIKPSEYSDVYYIEYCTLCNVYRVVTLKRIGD